MVKNEYIKIKNGKKEYVRKNKILDAYLKKIVDRQTGTLDIENTGIYQTDNQFSLNHILFKLDSPIEGIDNIGKNELQLLSENENVDGLNITNNGDNSLSLEGTAKEIEGETVQGTSFTLTDAQANKQASIIEIKGTGEKRKIPSEYQEVEYIEGTGTQWIDTGLIGNFTESLTVKSKFVLVEQTTSGEQALLGNKNSSGNGCTVFFSANSRNIKSWSGSGTAWTPASLTLGQITTFEHTWTVPKGRTANINGTSYSNTTIANNQTSNNTSFAILNDKPSATLAPAHIKLYYIEFYIDNILQRQLIPCYNIYTNVIGMYDTVYGTFYANMGTGTFGKGADIVYNNVTGDNEIVVSNENLFNINNAIDRPSWNNKICDRTITDANNFTLKSNATDDWCGIYLDNLDTTKNYTIKFTATLLEGVEGNSLYVGTADANSPRTAIYTNTPKEVEYTFTNSSKIYIKIISQARVQFSNVELAIGTTTNYIGHEGSRYSLNFSRIPSEYQEVEYIQTTGTQWINTGIAPSNDIRIKTDIEVSQTGQDKAVFGLYVIGTGGTSISNAYHLTPYSNAWYYGTNGGQGSAGTYSSVVGTRYNIDFNCDSNGHILINGQNITTYNETYGGGSYSNPIIGISWRGYSDGATRKGQFKYYSFKMLNKNTNQYIRNFIPCYRKSDNVIGMYDLITQTFYENAGTGTFLKGDNINTYNDLSENDKLWNNNGTWQLNNTAITDTYLLTQLQALDNIELYENLCYVDWVGIEKPTMTLKYNYDTKYNYDLGVQDFTLENGKEYTIETNGLNLILLNNDIVVYNNTGGSFTPASDLEITHAYLVINREQYYNVRIDLKVIQEFNLVTTDFDIHYAQDGNIVTNQEYSSNGIIARYQYTFNRDTEFRLYVDGSLVSLSQLNGRKITAIGFSNNWIGGGNFQSTRPVLAVLDTSNYDLRFNSAETLDITRVDSLSSDSQFFVKNNEVRGPIHLAPMGMPELKWSKTENDLLWFYKQGIARLEEVYLTNYPTNEGTKVLTMFDVYGEKTDDFQTNNNKINFKKIEVATGGKELRPNIALSPNNKVSPVTSGYKYVLYKYRIYQPLVKMQTGYEETDFFDTDLVYYMAQEIPHSGDLNLQIKYERS